MGGVRISFLPYRSMHMSVRRLVPFAAALALAVGAPAVMAADDRGVPADQVITAIETVASAHQGNIKDVEIDEKDNRLLVEVTVVDADGNETEVRVDPQTGQIVK